MSRLGELFEKLPENLFMDGLGGYGRLMTGALNSEAGRKLIEFSHRLSARAAGQAVRLAGLAGDSETVQVSREFIDRFFSGITEVEEESEEEWTFSFCECPYGFSGEEHADLCRAAMNFEEEFIDRLGGELIIEDRIPDGAPRCRFRVRNF